MRQVYTKLAGSFTSVERIAIDKVNDATRDDLFCLVEWCVSDPIEMMYLGIGEERRDRII